jgi:hypothetical protein
MEPDHDHSGERDHRQASELVGEHAGIGDVPPDPERGEHDAERQKTALHASRDDRPAVVVEAVVREEASVVVAGPMPEE